jgi:hypothetical protein
MKLRSFTELPGAKMRPSTPPSAPGDISPVFARQGLQVVNVRSKQVFCDSCEKQVSVKNKFFVKTSFL